MKKNLICLALIILISSIFLTSCKKEKDNLSINYLKFKEIAWNSLSELDKSVVTHDWEDAEASIVKNPDNDDKVVLIVFHTVYDILTCPIYVYMDIESETVIYPANIPLCL